MIVLNSFTVAPGLDELKALLSYDTDFYCHMLFNVDFYLPKPLCMQASCPLRFREQGLILYLWLSPAFELAGLIFL